MNEYARAVALSAPSCAVHPRAQRRSCGPKVRQAAEATATTLALLHGQLRPGVPAAAAAGVGLLPAAAC